MINTLLTTQTFQKLAQQPENKVCFECGAPSPTWASLPNAVFLCLTCAGEHRSLGVNVSYVRSVTLDDWEEKQLQMMLIGGNSRLKDYFQSVGIYADQNADRELGWKWRTKAAVYYRNIIRAQIEDREHPPQPSPEEAIEADPSIQVIRIMKPQQQQQPEEQKELGQASIYSREIPDNDDPLEKVKGFFVSSYNKTAEVTREAVRKVDQKISDPQFQSDVNQFKTQVSTKSKEIGDKTVVLAKEGFESVKTNVGSAWGFLKRKYVEATNKNTPSQVLDELPVGFESTQGQSVQGQSVQTNVNESGI